MTRLPLRARKGVAPPAAHAARATMLRAMLAIGVASSALFMASAPAVERGQAGVHVIASGPSCRECRVQRYLLATITDSLYPGGTGLSSWLALVSRRPNGEFFVTTQSELFLADRGGRISRQIGRSGRGPGEYQRPGPVMHTKHGHLVFDQSLRRVTTLTQNLEFVGTAPLPTNRWPAVATAAFSDGRYVLTGILRSDSSRRDHTLHIVNTDGTILRSFGGNGSVPPAKISSEHERYIAISGDSIIWAVHWNTYRIEKWDTVGNLRAVFQRKASWYQPWDSAAVPSSHIGQSIVYSVHEDEQRRLWIALFRKLSERPASVPMGQPYSDNMDTIIEVLDLAKRQVITTARLRGGAGEYAYGGFYHSSHRESSSGEPLIDVRAYRLAR